MFFQSVQSFNYIVYYIVQTSIPTILSRIYGFDTSKIEFCYLAIGVGVVIGGYINGMCPFFRLCWVLTSSKGKVVDLNYRVTTQKMGRGVNKVTGDDLRDFPIERASSRFSMIYILRLIACLIDYAWASYQKSRKSKHLSLPSKYLRLMFSTLCGR